MSNKQRGQFADGPIEKFEEGPFPGFVNLLRKRFSDIDSRAVGELRRELKLPDHTSAYCLEAAAKETSPMPRKKDDSRPGKRRSRIYRHLMAALAARKALQCLDELEPSLSDHQSQSSLYRLIDAAFFAAHHELRNAAVIGFGQQKNGKAAVESGAFGRNQNLRRWLAERDRILKDRGPMTKAALAREIEAATGDDWERIRKALRNHDAELGKQA